MQPFGIVLDRVGIQVSIGHAFATHVDVRVPLGDWRVVCG